MNDLKNRESFSQILKFSSKILCIFNRFGDRKFFSLWEKVGLVVLLWPETQLVFRYYMYFVSEKRKVNTKNVLRQTTRHLNVVGTKFKTFYFFGKIRIEIRIEIRVQIRRDFHKSD